MQMTLNVVKFSQNMVTMIGQLNKNC